MYVSVHVSVIRRTNHIDQLVCIPITLGVAKMVESNTKGTGWVSTENSFSDVSHHVDVHLVQHSEFCAVNEEHHMQIPNCHLGSMDKQMFGITCENWIWYGWITFRIDDDLNITLFRIDWWFWLAVNIDLDITAFLASAKFLAMVMAGPSSGLLSAARKHPTGLLHEVFAKPWQRRVSNRGKSRFAYITFFGKEIFKT